MISDKLSATRASAVITHIRVDWKILRNTVLTQHGARVRHPYIEALPVDNPAFTSVLAAMPQFYLLYISHNMCSSDNPSQFTESYNKFRTPSTSPYDFSTSFNGTPSKTLRIVLHVSSVAYPGKSSVQKGYLYMCLHVSQTPFSTSLFTKNQALAA